MKRLCLRCNKSFKSTGPFNRLCTSCRRRNEEGSERHKVYVHIAPTLESTGRIVRKSEPSTLE